MYMPDKTTQRSYRKIFERIHDNILLADAEGVILERTAGNATLIGYSNEERVHRPIFEVVHPLDAERARAYWQSVLDGSLGTERVEIRMRHKDGSWRWLEIGAQNMLDDAEIRAIVISGRDVTQAKRADEALRLQGAALAAAANAIVITDARGKIEWANGAFTRLTGFTLQEAAGRNPGSLLKSGRHDASFYHAMWATILAGEIWRGELVNKRRDGTLYTEDMTITPLCDASGRPSHFIAVKQDVTDRRKLEEQFRQAQKMDSIGRLAGGIAHDFNNQLSVILGHAELALAQLPAHGEVADGLREILDAARRSGALTRQLLTFARKQSVRPQVLDIGEEVLRISRMLQRLIGENIHLQCDIAADRWPVRMDPSHLDQVMTNLCVNARDAMPDVGTITVTLTNVTLDATRCARIAEAVPGDYVHVRVADTGSGIAPEILPNIFEPFFTTKGVGEGTGLGLATVYGAVTQANGFVAVESTLGVGTTFHLYLPRHVTAAAGRVTSPDEGTVDERARGTETILVVEDEEAVLRMTATSLSVHGYHVLAARSPSAALALAREHESRIALVLSDVVMPEMNGVDLVAHLRTVVPGLRAVFMSGYPGRSAHAAMLEAAGAAFLHKPFSMTELARHVRAALDA